jgi:hypothetical protein
MSVSPVAHEPLGTPVLVWMLVPLVPLAPAGPWMLEPEFTHAELVHE